MLRLTPLRNLDVQAMLYHKESGVILEIILRPQQLEIIITEQERQCLVHLEQSQVFPDA